MNSPVAVGYPGTCGVSQAPTAVYGPVAPAASSPTFIAPPAAATPFAAQVPLAAPAPVAAAAAPAGALISLGQQRNPVEVGQGLIGQPKAYVPGQPVRNWLRYFTP